jgi:hypothetical protein
MVDFSINKEILRFFLNHQRRRRLPTPSLPFTTTMPNAATKSATELLEEARRLDAIIRTALGPGGDVNATMARMESHLVRHSTLLTNDIV